MHKTAWYNLHFKILILGLEPRAPYFSTFRAYFTKLLSLFM